MLHMYEAIIITWNLCKFCSRKLHKGINAIMYYYFPSPVMEETTYHKNNHIYYLEHVLLSI